MTAKEFIESKLEELKPQKIELSATELPDFIYKTIASKKFRKFSLTPEYSNYIKETIADDIKDNLPLRFSFPFGAYKLWRLEEAPEVDWAELFTLMYYTKWLKPICDAYAPGVIFDFASDDIIVERMNNIPRADTEKYKEGFNQLIKFLEQYSPQNFKFTLTPISSFYTPEEFEKDLADKIEKRKLEYGGLPVLSEKEIRMTELNVKLKPGQADDPLWREKTELLHQAYYIVDKRRPYNRAKGKILVFPYSLSDGRSVAPGTTKTSVAKFWVGVGILKKLNDSFIEYILSPSQLEKAQLQKEAISIPGLDGKNFKEIKISN